MIGEGHIRWSGLATMLGGALCILEFGFIDILGSMLWILPPLFAVGVVGLYAGYAERLRRSGIFIALAAGVLSVAGFIGGAAFDGANDSLVYAGWLVFLPGIVILFVDLVLFGVAAIGTRMSLRWKIVPLVVGILPVVFLDGILLYKALSGWWVTDESLIRFGGIGSAFVIGGGWILLGYMLWSDAGKATPGTLSDERGHDAAP